MSKYRVAIVLILFLIAAFALVYRAVTLTLGEKNKLQTNLILMNRSPTSLELLNSHAVKLEAMTKNIEKTSFGDIKNAIEKTITLVNQSNLELKAQNDAWLEIQKQIKRDDVNFRSLKEQLAQLKSLEDERIISLKLLLDKAAQPSIYDTVFNGVLTFSLGVLSSILTTMTFSWFKKRKVAKSPRRAK